jgi:hypothetical protein
MRSEYHKRKTQSMANRSVCVCVCVCIAAQPTQVRNSSPPPFLREFKTHKEREGSNHWGMKIKRH